MIVLCDLFGRIAMVLVVLAYLIHFSAAALADRCPSGTIKVVRDV